MKEKIHFITLTFNSGIKTYVRADTVTQLVEVDDQTLVYTANGKHMTVQENVNEILEKIGGATW